MHLFMTKLSHFDFQFDELFSNDIGHQHFLRHLSFLFIFFFFIYRHRHEVIFVSVDFFFRGRIVGRFEFFVFKNKYSSSNGFAGPFLKERHLIVNGKECFLEKVTKISHIFCIYLLQIDVKQNWRKLSSFVEHKHTYKYTSNARLWTRSALSRRSCFSSRATHLSSSRPIMSSRSGYFFQNIFLECYLH